MSRLSRPIFLEGYDVFGYLDAWAKQVPTGHWTISQFMKNNVSCTLTWKFGESQIGSLERCATTPEEAVYLALEEYNKWNTSSR